MSAPSKEAMKAAESAHWCDCKPERGIRHHDHCTTPQIARALDAFRDAAVSKLLAGLKEDIRVKRAMGKWYDVDRWLDSAQERIR